ncbi:MAG TPA: DUF4214 domain-containing protein [Iamia sp.]|nr:DUF4214 domain-containing protein [Iamia sp.]
MGAAAVLVGLVAAGLVPAALPVAATVAPAGAPATGAPLPTGFGEPGTPVRPASERYVREAYDAVLRRDVDEPSLTYWGDRLDGSTSRGTFARHVVLSLESVRTHVAAVYEVFGRAPTTTERDASVAAIRARTTTVEQELVRLLATEEFYEREGGASPAGFVQALYNSVLDRSPDEAGSEYWLGRLEAGATRAEVAQGFVLAGDRLGPVVADAYDRVLARGADVGGRAYWAARIRRGESILDIDRYLLASAEAWGAGCSILDRTRCLLPFPNDELTLVDDTTDTGKRVVLKPPWVPGSTTKAFDPTEWNRQDGFSPGSAILLHSGGIDPEESNLPGLDDIGASLADDAPIVIVDTETGEEWPYWAELDSNAPTDAERALVIRPARNFLDGHTYAVGIGQMHDAEGDAIEAPSGFRIFRDDLPSNSRRVEEERVRAEFAIDQVAASGLDRDTLHMAWTFTVASTRNLAERAVHMRDEALGGLAGVTAPDFTVTNQTDEGDWTRVTGTYQVPLYLTGTGQPGSRLRLGDDDLPQAQGTATAPFTCVVPDAARTTPGRAALYGHGLLGTGEQAASGGPRDLAREHDMVFCGTDYWGMSEGDFGNTATIIGDLSRFPELADRNQQGLLNFMLLGRLMTRPDGLVSHAAFQGTAGVPAIDGTNLSYYGISQGGIMGGALVALSTDITRGVLGVPGTNYSTLLERSVDFDPFFAVMAGSYPSALDRIMMISVIQMLWDRGEANGYANHMTTDPLPGTPEHEVLMHVAVGDHQVATAAADVMARTYGAATNDPPLVEDRSPDVEPLWGIDRIEAWPHAGSASIYWDSGAVWPPLENKPSRVGDDPHGDPRSDPDARDQISEFLKPAGVVVDVCDDDPCMVEP